MRPLDQFELWAHGTRFVVRRVPACTGYTHRKYQTVSGYRFEHHASPCESAPAGYVLFGPHGFIARLPRRNLKRWAGHFGLKYLLKSVP